MDCAAAVVDHRIPAAEAGLAFVNGKAELLPTASASVEAVACLLGADPALTVQIEVHTDARGADAWNLRLSQDRADAVRAALIERGVADGRVTAVGYGETLPLGGPSSADRRVELHTEPPSSRPPRPSPPPPPAPDPCAGWRDLGGTVLPWGTCSTTSDGWTCVLPFSLAEATERVGACFGGTVDRDGDLLVLRTGSATLILRADAEGRAVLSR
jgi:hypothetical protein